MSDIKFCSGLKNVFGNLVNQTMQDESGAQCNLLEVPKLKRVQKISENMAWTSFEQ